MESFAPVCVAMVSSGHRGGLDRVPVCLEPALAIRAGVRPPARPSAARAKHAGSLLTPPTLVDPMPRLSEAEDVRAAILKWQCGAVGNNGCEPGRPHHSNRENSGPNIERNDPGTTSKQLPGRNPGARTPLENLGVREGLERVVYRIRIGWPPRLVLVGNRIERGHRTHHGGGWPLPAGVFLREALGMATRPGACQVNRGEM